MSINNDGYSGVEIEQIALEKNVLVGVQSPNLNPAVKIEAKGRTLPLASISENGGMYITPSHGFLCSYADTSWLSHGGIYSVTAGNKINFNTGSGGFDFLTSGPLKFNTVYADCFATHAFNVSTRLFTVVSSQRTHLMGTRIDIDYDDIYFTGNTNFINNAAFNGSVFINGELYCTHMTTMGQLNRTKDSTDLIGYINPGQSFVAFSGASVIAKQTQPSIDCQITIPFPEPIGQTLKLPCKIVFTNGISLASDTTIAQTPDVLTVIAQGSMRTISTECADVIGPGHDHEFIGPSCNYKSDTASVFGEAAEMMKQSTPSKAKKTQINGCSSFDEFLNQCQEAATKKVKDYFLRAKSYIYGQFKNLW